MKKVLVIGIAALLYAAAVLGLWSYLTSDGHWDIESGFDSSEQVLAEIEAQGLGLKSLSAYVTGQLLVASYGASFVMDADDRIIACAHIVQEDFLGKDFGDLLKPGSRLNRDTHATQRVTTVSGKDALVRMYRCCGHDVALVALEEDVMWARDRAVPLLAVILLVAFAAFVWLILHQMGLSARLKVYIDAEERQIAEERSAAAQIQMSALPRKFPAFPALREFDIHADMTPAKEVGGDFYDFFRLPDGRIAFLVADVTGKGVPAALFMMNAKTTIKLLLNFGLPLAAVATRANAALKEGNTKHMLVSAWIGVLDVSTGEVEFVNAGHNPPVRFGGGETAYCRETHGPMLGAIRTATYSSGRFRLAPGERLLLYTDGVTEAHDSADRLFGEERLKELLGKQAGASPAEACAAVRREVDAFAGACEQFDDITVMALEYRGPLAAKSRTFAADPAGVAAALGFVEKTLADEPGELQVLMLTAADEIFSNIVKHSGSPDFAVQVDSADGLVRLACSDSGRAWNPLTDSVFDPNAPAASRKKGGMGIQIVWRTMDHVLYARRDGRNELMVAKTRSKANV